MKRFILTPRAKQDVNEIDKRHRLFLVYSYLIVYRHETKPLQVIRVLHAARDVQSILGSAADSP